MKSPRLVLTTILLLLPAAAGGSQQAPEIRDAVQDVDTEGGWHVTVLSPEIDIVRGWFESNATHLGVSLEVLDLGHRTRSDEWLLAWLEFDCGDDTISVQYNVAPPPPSDPYASIWLWRENGSFDSVWPRPMLSIDGNVMHVEVPRDLLHCTVVTRPAAGSTVQFPPVTGLISPFNNDNAPGNHYGDDYTMN